MENQENTENIGKLTDDEQKQLTETRQVAEDIKNKLFQLGYQQFRLYQYLSAQEEKTQAVIDAITQRLNLAPGQEWVALADGSIRLVNKPNG